MLVHEMRCQCHFRLSDGQLRGALYPIQQYSALISLVCDQFLLRRLVCVSLRVRPGTYTGSASHTVMPRRLLVCRRSRVEDVGTIVVVAVVASSRRCRHHVVGARPATSSPRRPSRHLLAVGSSSYSSSCSSSPPPADDAGLLRRRQVGEDKVRTGVDELTLADDVGTGTGRRVPCTAPRVHRQTARRRLLRVSFADRAIIGRRVTRAPRAA